MSNSTTIHVTGPDSLRGTIDTSAWPIDGSRAEAQVILTDGRRLMTPVHLLRKINDCEYEWAGAVAAIQPAPEPHSPSDRPTAPQAVIPVIHEQLNVATRTVESGRVRIRKVVHEEMQTVDQPLKREQVTVERVAINRMVDGPQPPRSEDDVLIIPVVQEVLVIEKRLMLTEELHVRKQGRRGARAADRHAPPRRSHRRARRELARSARWRRPPARRGARRRT